MISTKRAPAALATEGAATLAAGGVAALGAAAAVLGVAPGAAGSTPMTLVLRVLIERIRSDEHLSASSSASIQHLPAPNDDTRKIR